MAKNSLSAIMEKGLRPKKTRLSLSMEFIGNCIIRNGSIEPADEQSHIGDDNEVYEVLRVEAGKPLFVEDHLARWRDSMKAVGVALPKWTDSFETLITWLIACHTLPNCDMRIVASADGDIQCGYVQTEYPSLQMYAEGVKAELLNAERETPRLKIYHAGMRSEAQEQQDETGAYESLLVNAEGRITEGSRSNAYFIAHDGTIHTAGDDEVLGGIMRKHILALCAQIGIKVVFECVVAERRADFVSAFISSTPMRILPVREIDGALFDVQNQTLRRLMSAMEELVAKQIKC